MNAKLIVKGRNPSVGGWQIELSQDHVYKQGEGPDYSIQKDAMNITGKHLMELAALLRIIGYDPSTLRFSIDYKPAPAEKEEQP